jgi:NADPH:quinone reductase-like Zn-dependent oxidoreductase
MRVIATEEEDLVKEINEITGGQGARVVFDPVGGPTLLELIKAMSFQGILYLHGALSDRATAVPPLALIAKILTIKGHNIWVTSGNPQRQKAAVDFVINGLEKGTTETNHRQSLSIRQDCRCAPLSRSERSDRQDRRHDLIPQGPVEKDQHAIHYRVEEGKFIDWFRDNPFQQGHFWKL